MHVFCPKFPFLSPFLARMYTLQLVHNFDSLVLPLLPPTTKPIPSVLYISTYNTLQSSIML